LTYHVIADQAVDASTAISLDGSDVAMLNGETISLSVREGNLYINESLVVAADIVASNGIIHVIDAVLTPPEA
jgi:transforming growth factor-beta-induced protein